MLFKLNQFRRSLYTAAPTRRVYCVFKQRVPNTATKAVATNSTVRSARNQAASRPRARLLDPDAPSFQDGNFSHRAHNADGVCLIAHLNGALQIHTYITQLSTHLEENWNDICAAQERIGLWIGRLRVIQDHEDLALEDAVPRFQDEQLKAQRRLRTAFAARRKREAELARATILLKRCTTQACEAAAIFYSSAQNPQDGGGLSRLMNEGLQTSLALVRHAESELNYAQEQMRLAGELLLANDSPVNSVERMELIDAIEYTNMRFNACRTSSDICTSGLFQILERRMGKIADPIYPLTENNLAEKDTVLTRDRFRPEVRFDREDNRDEEGRPLFDENDGTYLPSAAPLLQETSGLYDLRIALRAAENRLQTLQQNHEEAKALHFVLYPNAELTSFDATRSAVDDDNDEEGRESFQDREFAAIQDLQAAQQLYDTARQIVQEDIESRPAHSELSLASQVSDYMDEGSADISHRRWARRAVPAAPVRLWQSAIARDCVLRDALQAAATTPRSVTSLESVSFSEEISNGNGSDSSEAGTTKARRERWMERRRELGFDLNRYGWA